MSLGISILVFFIMLFIGTPIAVCLAGTGIIWLLADPSIPNLVFASKIYGATDSFAYMAIPFFMMAGQVMEQTGITEKFIDFAKSIIGHVRGGVAHTATVAGVIMAGYDCDRLPDDSRARERRIRRRLRRLRCRGGRLPRPDHSSKCYDDRFLQRCRI